MPNTFFKINFNVFLLLFLLYNCCRGGAGREVSNIKKQNDSVPDPEVFVSMEGNRKVTENLMTPEEIEKIVKSLEIINEKMEPPRPGDWLWVHSEPGQSFTEYRSSHQSLLNSRRRIIYIQPLGSFTEGQKKIMERTADFMERFFGIEVKIKKSLSLENIPSSAKRVHPEWGDRQINSGYILNKILIPLVSDDAVGLLGFTATDLWPGEGWNFVFGEASLSDRVGVWSIYRKGNADGSPAEFRLVLRRTLQTAVHEMGHMLGMLHCKKWKCVMNGCNSLEESDRRPLSLCPECLAKVLWVTGTNPVARFEKLKEFYKNEGMEKELNYVKKALEIVSENRK